MSHAYTCPVCDTSGKPFAFAWTDTHGVGQCWRCGSPAMLLHYEDGKRVDRPPASMVSEKWVPRLRDYWRETGNRIPGGHSFPGGQELATQKEIEAFDAWAAQFEAEEPTP